MTYDIYLCLVTHESLRPSNADGFHALWTKRDKSGKTPLHYLAKTDLVDIAIEAFETCPDFPTSVNWLDDNKFSPLFYAARNFVTDINDEEIQKSMFIILLRKFGFDVSQEGRHNYTPLHQLAKVGNWQMMDYLSRNGMLYGSYYDQEGLTEIRIHNSKGFTLLESSAEGCNKFFTRYMLVKWMRVDPDLPKDTRDQLFQKRSEFIDKGHFESKNLMFIACQFGRISRIEGYIRALMLMGGSIDPVDCKGNNLIHAFSKSKARITDKDQFWVDKRDPYGGDCWHLLKFIHHQSPHLIFARNIHGDLPLHMAVDHGKTSTVASLLLLAVNTIDKYPEEKSVRDSILFNYVNQKNTSNETPLFIAFSLMNGYTRPLTNGTKLTRKLHEWVKIAELLIMVGAKVSNPMRAYVKKLQVEYNSSKQLEKLVRLVMIFTPHPVPCIWGRLANLPTELYEYITHQSILQEMVSSLQENRDGSESDASDSSADNLDDAYLDYHN
jgi:hypothetical protein